MSIPLWALVHLPVVVTLTTAIFTPRVSSRTFQHSCSSCIAAISIFHACWLAIIAEHPACTSAQLLSLHEVSTLPSPHRLLNTLCLPQGWMHCILYVLFENAMGIVKLGRSWLVSCPLLCPLIEPHVLLPRPTACQHSFLHCPAAAAASIHNCAAGWSQPTPASGSPCTASAFCTGTPVCCLSSVYDHAQLCARPADLSADCLICIVYMRSCAHQAHRVQGCWTCRRRRSGW